MSEYKGIKGLSIQSLSADPANPNIGQVWYNSTSASLKLATTASGAWATGNNMNTARYLLAGAGTQTAALGFGGATPPNSAATEEYDGNSWTVGGNLTAASYRLAGCGTQTAGLAFGGNPPPGVTTTQLYDGTSWANSPTGLNTGRLYHGGVGTQPTALSFGGQTGGTQIAATEEWTGLGALVTKTITVS